MSDLVCFTEETSVGREDGGQCGSVFLIVKEMLWYGGLWHGEFVEWASCCVGNLWNEGG